MVNSPSLDTQVVCPACGNTGHQTLSVVAKSHTMQRCRTCKLVFVTPVWTAPIAKNIFQNYQGWPAGIAGGVSIRTAGLTQIARYIMEYGDSVSQWNSRLLDIGCADGEFFQIVAAQNPSFELFGAEPDPKWANHDYGNAVVKHRFLQECAFPSEMFDVVTILDAFFYVPDPLDELREITRILKPEGLLIFDIPGQLYLQIRGAIGSLLGIKRTRLFEAYPFYYSHRSVETLLAQSSLELENVIVDRGTVQDRTWLKALMPFYVRCIQLLTVISSTLQEAGPKLIYIIRKR